MQIQFKNGIVSEYIKKFCRISMLAHRCADFVPWYKGLSVEFKINLNFTSNLTKKALRTNLKSTLSYPNYDFNLFENFCFKKSKDNFLLENISSKIEKGLKVRKQDNWDKNS
ncbi:hypothetical protein BpHYR1_005909 [Brachionus plicatilis]|uniref:Uncharacterized protein n=1 Tax=Brachionus plicatilis TaxID=10195 RepID=A0A3M7PTR5_BRAPC|nr:hypothetical protein BpHYR1_005909 [Brachionus plicatilis]